MLFLFKIQSGSAIRILGFSVRGLTKEWFRCMHTSKPNLSLLGWLRTWYALLLGYINNPNYYKLMASYST